MTKAIAVFVLMASASLIAGERPKSNIHVSHLTENEVAITCLNGGDATGIKTGDVLVISCGK
jgi:hypothetical protein